MFTRCLRYVTDPFKLKEFEHYAKLWTPIVEKFGGKHRGYFLPHEGANNIANDWVIYPITMESEKTLRELSQSQHGILRMAIAGLETVDRHTNQPEVFKYAMCQEDQQVIYKLVFYEHFVVYAVG